MPQDGDRLCVPQPSAIRILQLNLKIALTTTCFFKQQQQQNPSSLHPAHAHGTGHK
jgi:hypothetical protein